VNENNRSEEIRSIEEMFEQTIRLISAYKRHSIQPPFALKGNLGEFIIQKELLKKFSKHEISFHGGSHPEYDISIDGIKIQVKTQIKHKPIKRKKWELDYESSPTIRKSIITEKKCAILILVILYPDQLFSKIEKTNIYIFNQDDFKYFDHIFCWSGKSKGDFTIVNILNVKGEPSPRMKEAVEVYNKPEYKQLFQDSKDNWEKIESLLRKC
jgi:hypothetical protein